MLAQEQSLFPESNKIADIKELMKIYIDAFNDTFGKNYRPTPVIKPGLIYWLEYYSIDEIVVAVKNLKKDPFWGNKNIKPTLLLRRRDTRGEPVDRIGDMLNLETPAERIAREEGVKLV